MVSLDQVSRKLTATLLTAVLLSTVAVPAAAEEVQGANGPKLFDAAPMSDAELATVTGRENDNYMTATGSNSSIIKDNNIGDNSVSGSVNVTDSAFQNVSGISMVNFNTGAQASINAQMNVNLQINYAPASVTP